MVKSQHNPGMVINTDLIETIQVEIDTSATIESEDTPYIVYAQFISGHSIIIGRFETEAEAIEYVNGFTENYERSENTMTENKRIELCPFCGEKEEIEVESYRADGKDWFYVTCHTCQAQGPASSTEEDAIDMWNWREEE